MKKDYSEYFSSKYNPELDFWTNYKEKDGHLWMISGWGDVVNFDYNETISVEEYDENEIWFKNEYHYFSVDEMIAKAKSTESSFVYEDGKWKCGSFVDHYGCY